MDEWDWRKGHTPVTRTVGEGEPQGGVLIYIDNSNIWINTMHYSARKLKFINDIQQDQRVRLNVHQMVATAADHRPIIRCVLYGSEPPPVETFWNNMKDMKNMDVRVTKKSTFSNREREVDQNINVDIGEEMVIHREHANYNGTIILFTGDGGMASAVEKAVSKYNWNVEIWAYKHSLAKIYLERFKDQPKVRICLLDEYFDQFSYYTLKWKDGIPKERSFVFSFDKLAKSERPEVLRKFVEAVTKLVKLPMSAKYIRDFASLPQDNNHSSASSDPVGPAHLALVCNVSAQILKEDSRFDALLKASLLHNEGPHSLSNNVKHQVILQFSKDYWNKIIEVIYGDRDIIQDLPSGLKDRLEKLILEILSITRSSPNATAAAATPTDHVQASDFIRLPPHKYDFNRDVFRKAERFLESPHLMSSAAGDDKQLVEELKSILKKHKPVIRSIPQFLQDMRLDTIPEVRFEAPSKEDGGEDGFQVVTSKRSLKKKFQKYSEKCQYGFRCRKGFECTFSHSSQQLEFFKVQPNAGIRSTYKHKECDHWSGVKGGGAGCKYKGPLSYMCPYAHGTFCLKCQKDADGGHCILNCPDNQTQPAQAQQGVSVSQSHKLWIPKEKGGGVQMPIRRVVTPTLAEMEQKWPRNNSNGEGGGAFGGGGGGGGFGNGRMASGMSSSGMPWGMSSGMSPQRAFYYHDPGRYVDVGCLDNVQNRNNNDNNNHVGGGGGGVWRRPSWAPPLEEDNFGDNGAGYYSNTPRSMYPPPGFY